MNGHPILRVSDAHFVRDGCDLIEPFSIELERGGRASLHQPDATAAKTAARVAAAIVKPTSGSVFVGDFDARVQAPQAKRLVGFVPYGGFNGNERSFDRELRFRAQVWGVAREPFERRAQAVLAGLEGLAEAYARAIALALAPEVSLVVVEDASSEVAQRIERMCAGIALLITSAA